MTDKSTFIYISIEQQTLYCFENDTLVRQYIISSGKNGVGEQNGSGCTPRGWHKIHSIIGSEHPINCVLISRVWTGEIYSDELAKTFPDRDWILTRILRLEGLEPGRNQGDNVDTFNRYIYFHGTPDSTQLGIPGSKGCIRVNNQEIIELANWATTDTLVYIK